MRKRFAQSFIVGTLFLSVISCFDLSATTVQLPLNSVDSYSDVSNLDTGASSGTPGGGPIYNALYGSNFGLSVTRTVLFSGPVIGQSTTYDAGDFSTTQSANLGVDASMGTHTLISGFVAGDRYVTADSIATYSNVIAIAGPTPTSVVFHLSLEGTGTGGNGGSGWNGDLFQFGYYGAVDFDVWNFDETTGVVNYGNGYTRLTSIGDGSVQTLDEVVPWSRVENGQLAFELSTVAFGRVSTSAGGANVNLTSDFSGSLTGVSFLDGSGNDITPLESTSFQNAPTPEPGSASLALLGGLALLARRRRSATISHR